MVSKTRFRLDLFLLTGLCLAQAGCLETLYRPHTPYSDRTATAYPSSPLPLQPTPVNKAVDDYVKRLEEVRKAQASQPVGMTMRPMTIPIVPLEDGDLAPTLHGGPFDPRARRRRVAIPALKAPQVAAPLTPAPAAQVAPAPTPAAPASEPVETRPTDGAIGEFIAAVQTKADAAPDNLDLQIQSRLLLAAAGKDTEALRPIPALAAEENRRVADLLKMVMSLRDKAHVAETPEEATRRLEALETLTEQLKAVADLQIPVVKLCRQVDGFGVYIPFASNTFLAGQTNPVIVYCELRNFSVNADESGMHRTRLNLKLALYDAQGQLAQPAQADSNIEDVSANRRNDFYLTRIFRLKSTLDPGSYTLKVTVEDPGANKARSASIDVVLAKPK